jgi:hypothetical protein
MDSKYVLSEEDKKKSYAKYFDRPMEPIPAEKLAVLQAGSIDPALALQIEDRNKLFDPGYLENEVGYTVLPNGTGYLANLTVMPDVTTEMFDWWFAWHPLDDLRYVIWDPEDHFYARTDNRAHNLNANLSLKERGYGVKHAVLEDIGAGPDELIIEFESPGFYGFDESKIGTKYCSSIVCGNGHSPNPGPGSVAAFMTHFVRELEQGIELRSRFWIGYQIIDKKAVSVLPPGVSVPIEAPMGLFAHNITEFTNLSTLLPLVYAEERDNW